MHVYLAAVSLTVFVEHIYLLQNENIWSSQQKT